MKHEEEKRLRAIKLIEKILDATNSKQYYQFYLKRKNTKLVRWSKIITQEPKTFQNPKSADIK